MPELTKTMRDMAMEMEKAGLIEDMVEDVFADMDVSAMVPCVSYHRVLTLSSYREKRWRTT